MEIKLQVPFQQILKLVKQLSPAQKARLKQELSENFKSKPPANKEELISYLLKGPVYTSKEIRVIENNRKSIKEWRKKS